MTPSRLTRRRFGCLAGLGLVGAAGYGGTAFVRRVREAADRSVTHSQLKQLGYGLCNYADTHGRFPPAYVLGPDGRRWHSWRVLILPFIEEQQLYRDYHFDEPWDGPRNRTLAGRMPRMFALRKRDDPDLTTADYLAVVGPRTMWPGAVGRGRQDITALPGGAVLLAENHGLGVHWMEPRDLDVTTMSFEFNHPDGLSSRLKAPSVVTADDTVLTLNPYDDPDALRAMLTAGPDRTAG